MLSQRGTRGRGPGTVDGENALEDGPVDQEAPGEVAEVTDRPEKMRGIW